MARRIHVMGPSGSGTSTLARGLASAFDTQCFDTDDFFWEPTDPPFLVRRPVAERLRLMEEVFLPRRDWVLSGSLTSWSGPILPRLTHVVFLYVPAAQRLARLRRRERLRADPELTQTPEWQAAHAGFLDWAMSYDDPNFTGRSRAAHEAWLATLDCPVIRIDGVLSPDEVLRRALAELDPGRHPA